MNAHRRLKWVLLLFLGFVAVCAVFWCLGFHDEASFAIDMLGAIAVVFAVVTALYGDSLREITQPIELKIEVPPVTNNFLDKKTRDSTEEDVLCFHLRVRDIRSARPVTNCRVWLARILDVKDGHLVENFRFAVPRLMPWAPAEFDLELRSFVGHQAFDLGVLYPRIGVFEVAVNKKQGGGFQHEFQFPEVRQYIFQIEVDGLLSAREHTVQVEIERCGKTTTWPFEFRAVVKPQTPG